MKSQMFPLIFEEFIQTMFIPPHFAALALLSDFAQDHLMDEIAEICGISPYEIRQINGYRQGSVTASGQTLSEHKVSLMQVIDKAVVNADYHKKREQFNSKK